MRPFTALAAAALVATSVVVATPAAAAPPAERLKLSIDQTTSPIFIASVGIADERLIPAI